MQPHVRIWSRKATAIVFLTLFGLATAPGCEEDAWYCTGSTWCYSSGSEAECLAIDGCTMNGGCGLRNCYQLSEAECDSWCSWNGSACRGYDPECDAYSDTVTCNGDYRCIWTPGCGGTPTIRCGSLYEQDTCEAVSYCRWERSTSAIVLF